MNEDIEGIVALIAIIAAVFIVSFGFSTSLQPDYVVPIASLNDNSRIYGSFTLGSGSVKSEPVFVVYSQLRNGGYQLETYPADQCTIYMDSDTLPHIQVYRTVVSFYSLQLPGCEFPSWRTYDIHVPKGTIVQQYRLDGQI